MHVYNYIMSTSQLSLPHEQTVTSKGCGLIAFFYNDFAIDLGIDVGTAKFDQITCFLAFGFSTMHFLLRKK